MFVNLRGGGADVSLTLDKSEASLLTSTEICRYGDSSGAGGDEGRGGEARTGGGELLI